MTTELDIEDIKHEITRWAVTKSPNLYQHFAEYLGIDRKEVSKLFKANEGIQAQINQYFQEERVQEEVERKQQLENDLVQLNDIIQTVIAEKRTTTTDQIVKATGIARCNIKIFAQTNVEIWREATGIKTLDERAQLKAERHALLLSQQRAAKKLSTEQREAEKKEKAERHALVLAQHAENRRLKAKKIEKRCQNIAEQRFKASVAQTRAIAKEYQKKMRQEKKQKIAAKQEAMRLKQASKTSIPSRQFSSHAVCHYAYERGRLVKKIYFKLSVIELRKIGYAAHINLSHDGKDCFGIYVSDHDHLGNHPYTSGPDFHVFSFTWHKKMCEEPRVNKMAPIDFKLVETEYKKGFCFKLPEQFFMSYIPD